MSDNYIELKNASFCYPNGFLANDSLNLRIGQGEAAAIVGQNGAGKTTAVKMINGLYKPSKGDVFVNAVNTKTKTTAQISRMVGYVFQNPDDQIFNRTVREEIEYMPKYLKLPPKEVSRLVNEAVELTGIKHYLDENPFDIPYSTRKFVTIAAVLATSPMHIILDEPTAGQDLSGIKILRELIQYLCKKNITVITITHDMEFVADNFNRVIAMANKHIIMDDTVEKLFGNDDVLAECRIKKNQIACLSEMLGCKPRIISRDDMRKFLLDKASGGQTCLNPTGKKGHYFYE
jgi:energy-coupling factor transport system ATP-binding protein